MTVFLFLSFSPPWRASEVGFAVGSATRQTVAAATCKKRREWVARRRHLGLEGRG
jgi:hypothetical protein